jgi:hypothetical protein
MNAQGVLNAQIAWQLQSCPERQSWWPPKGLNLLCGIKTPSQERLSSNGKNTHITSDGAPRAQGWEGGLS